MLPGQVGASARLVLSLEEVSMPLPSGTAAVQRAGWEFDDACRKVGSGLSTAPRVLAQPPTGTGSGIAPSHRKTVCGVQGGPGDSHPSSCHHA